jgi:hypothetical protein
MMRETPASRLALGCCGSKVDGSRERYGWLEARDVLIMKADRQEPLVVLRLSLAVEIAKLRAG